jgi:hypothetical protein
MNGEVYLFNKVMTSRRLLRKRNVVNMEFVIRKRSQGILHDLSVSGCVLFYYPGV